MKVSETLGGLLLCFFVVLGQAQADDIDFNRDIRSILSNRCLTCHGPDEAERKADLRLDTAAGSRADLGGYAAIVPGDPAASELLKRVITEDEDDRMPPAKSGDALTEDEIDRLRRWIQAGADYAKHWAYEAPVRSSLPTVSDASWVRNPIDHFILARLDAEGMEPSAPADRWALARRLAIDLTGLPPQLEDAEAFVQAGDDDSYERYVEGLLHSDAFGERWARVWLDLARYADSAGYADDPPRTIWGYRDYVIRALNDNMPFDQFTVEQLAGDLLPNPTEDQLIATAFHRNTMTNNEGGTSDEQFRNEAIVDRVNTTMQVWMGTTMACAQCHTHKYDPITQEEYFQFFAFFNNTEDSDKRNEQPTISLYTQTQKQQEKAWRRELEMLKNRFEQPSAILAKEQQAWEDRMQSTPEWKILQPESATATTRELEVRSDGTVVALGERPERDTYRVPLNVKGQEISALRVKTLAQESNFAVTQVQVIWDSDVQEETGARYLRIELPGKGKILSLAEVEVLSEGVNVARGGATSQSSTAFGGDSKRAIDGNTDGNYQENSTTHTAQSDGPWWELDLGEQTTVDEVRIWNRTDGGDGIGARLRGYSVRLLDEKRSVVFETKPEGVPAPSQQIAIDGPRPLGVSVALADFEQKGFPASAVLQSKLDNKRAWAVGGELDQSHELILVLSEPLNAASGTLEVRIRQESRHQRHLIEAFQIAVTGSSNIAEYAQSSEAIRELVQKEPAERTAAERESLVQYFRTIAPSLEPTRSEIAALEKRLADHRPYTTVPVFRELDRAKRRTTKVQVRGNYLNTEQEVSEGTPAAFHPLPEGAPKDRLSLARWLVSRDNPLTARVIANRHWEQLFGMGIVTTSEEFGSQGELPSHPALLDWLAVELMDSGWDLKHLLKLIVTSATYRQSSSMTDASLESDPANQFLGRGPRFRLSAEMIRDQALSIAGLLSDEKFGPPVRPVQPKMGLSAAFGSGIDWEPSQGADRYRRGLYTYWRRSNPYPSMTTFDAPNREVCTVRRPRSNTPLQALVTLNDPVYVEAAQALARRIVAQPEDASGRIEWAFRRALIRPPSAHERERLLSLYHSTREVYAEDPEEAKAMATIPLGEPEPGADLIDLAAWTVLSNVILNLDEIFLKR